jgi:integrase
MLTWSAPFSRSIPKAIASSSKKIRQVPLTPSLLALLRTLKGQHPVFVFSYVAAKSFRNPATGKQMMKGQRYPVTKGYLRDAARDDWAKAGVDATFHDLRRTAGRQIYDATGDIRAAQQFLGHNSVATTEIYLGVSGEHEVRATMRLRDDYIARMRAEAAKGQRVMRLQQRGRSA